jgi:hypothetical protein
MKYLKTYENLNKENEYEIDDYVHLAKEDSWKVYPDVKIIKIITYDNKDNEIRVESQMKTSNSIKTFWIDLEEIERKSTPEEIENYELRKNTNKYNL